MVDKLHNMYASMGGFMKTNEDDLLHMEGAIAKTLEKPPLLPEIVIDACDHLVQHMDQMVPLLSHLDAHLLQREIQTIQILFSREGLEARLKRELGGRWGTWEAYQPYGSNGVVKEALMPLGVLLHITAGNAAALPIVSVVEGLLTGNINILKLSSSDSGMTSLLLQKLIEIAPVLSQYVYVADYSSKETHMMQSLISMSDAVVVYGGDAAVSSLRNMIPPEVKLIAWGHKMSFGYVTKDGLTQDALQALAQHIADTQQLLCSSCQGIFIDTCDMREVHAFCQRFLPVLEEAISQQEPLDLGVRGQIALQLQTLQLQNVSTKSCSIYSGHRCSVTAYHDAILQPALQRGNLWVAPLPKKEILRTLRKHKGHLQTVGIACTIEEKTVLRDMFFRLGVVNLTTLGDMSATYCGMPHDGEYTLRAYLKRVSDATDWALEK